MGRKIIGIAGKVAGPKGTWRRRWVVLLSLAIAVAAGVTIVRAVHATGAFEMDGNAVNLAQDDWDEVCYQVTGNEDCGTTIAAVANVASWTGDIFRGGTDPFAVDVNATIFTGGGSKDGIDINQWAWKDGAGGLPDKDNLSHSFAARYSLTPSAECPNGLLPDDPDYLTAPCEVLFFGSDRYDNSGDAQQAFWFLQNRITLGDPKNKLDNVGGGTKFIGVHEPGDLLVISEFSNGGTVSNIFVYVWDPTVTGNLRLIAGDPDAKPPVSANCQDAVAGDSHCGQVNEEDGTPSPWLALDKSGNTTYLAGEFFEAGINLSLLGLANECFSSVLSETRFSTSVTAVLKDFVLGQFAQCGASLKTQASATTISPGGNISDSATITVTGVTNPDAPTGIVSFYLCGPGVTSCATTGTPFAQVNLNTATVSGNEYTVTSGNVSPALTTPGTYCFAASWPGDTTYQPPQGTTAFRDDGTNECFTVQATTTTTSAQTWLPNDSATVTSQGNVAITGTLRFTLYSGLTCGMSGGSVLRAAEDFALSNATSPATRNTTNGSHATIAHYSVTGEGTHNVSWKVEFIPGTGTNLIGSVECETSVVTIDNDT